jgi:large repetitive protein
MPNFQGVWSLSEQYQAIGSQNWPMAPGAPTGVSAAAGDAQATVSFTAPSFTGVPPGVTQYRAISDPGGVTQTGSASPITVTGLSNGTSYTFSVQATNGVQFGPAGVSGSVSPAAAVALFFGGQGPSTDSDVNVIDYVTISSAGNATDFGDTGATAAFTSSSGNASRSLVGAMRYGGATSNVIEYVTPTSAGNATDFGDLTSARFWAAGTSNSTRAVFAGGGEGNVIDYVTIASTGDATDFGDLTIARDSQGGAASPTRAVFAGGSGNSNVIDYITLASTGNATDFGDLSEGAEEVSGCSSSTRALFNEINGKIEYITIATTGNATLFGELSVANTASGTMAASSETRGLFAGGLSGTRQNRIEFVTIASTGNGTDFGDLTVARNRGSGTSTAHGGLS